VGLYLPSESNPSVFKKSVSISQEPRRNSYPQQPAGLPRRAPPSTPRDARCCRSSCAAPLHAVPKRSCSTPVPRAAAAPDLHVVAGFPVPYAAAAVLSHLSGEAGSRSSKEKMEPAPRLISAARRRSRGPCRHGGDGLGRNAATMFFCLCDECN